MCDICSIPIPTVSLDVISLVTSSCGYYRGQIEPRAAHEFAVHVATQRGRAKRLQHRHPPRAQPVAPLRERHCRRPRLPPRRGTDQAPSRDPGHPGGAHGRRNVPIASPCHGMRCPPVSPLFASWPWLLHTGCSLEALDMTVHERNHERGYSRYKSVLAITPRRSAMWGSSPVARTSPASRQRDRCNAVMGRKAGDIFLSKVLFDIKPDNKLLYKVFPVMR
jgi:hypothetical protein